MSGVVFSMTVLDIAVTDFHQKFHDFECHRFQKKFIIQSVWINSAISLTVYKLLRVVFLPLRIEKY
jgi:hypothetical protein